MGTRISLIAFTVFIGIFFTDPCIFAEDTTVQKGKENAMPVQLQWFGHASFKISSGSDVIYIDPWKLKSTPHDATIVLVSHSHFDHYSAEDIAKVSGATTKLIAAEDVIQDVIKNNGKGQALKPGQSIDVNGIKITGIPAYNLTKRYHQRSKNWLGFVIEIAGKRIYYAGDTDATDEMKALKNIDLALLPVGGTFTMDAAEAADATKYFKPKQAIPCHWGDADVIGSQADADNFKKLAACKVTVLKPGESITID